MCSTHLIIRPLCDKINIRAVRTAGLGDGPGHWTARIGLAWFGTGGYAVYALTVLIDCSN